MSPDTILRAAEAAIATLRANRGWPAAMSCGGVDGLEALASPLMTPAERAARQRRLEQIQSLRALRRIQASPPRERERVVTTRYRGLTLRGEAARWDASSPLRVTWAVLQPGSERVEPGTRASSRRDAVQFWLRLGFAALDPAAPDTLGWRAWDWDAAVSCLVSPHLYTCWRDPELRVKQWDDSAAIRGVAGIHARRMPLDWRRAEWTSAGGSEGPHRRADLVTGIVERYGRAVVGPLGWRAEWVVIRGLRAPRPIWAAVARAYPDVPVVDAETGIDSHQVRALAADARAIGATGLAETAERLLAGQCDAGLWSDVAAVWVIGDAEEED